MFVYYLLKSTLKKCIKGKQGVKVDSLFFISAYSLENVLVFISAYLHGSRFVLMSACLLGIWFDFVLLHTINLYYIDADNMIICIKIISLLKPIVELCKLSVILVHLAWY